MLFKRVQDDSPWRTRTPSGKDNFILDCFAQNEQIHNQVDPNEEAKKANEAVMGNVVIFALFVGLIRVSPRILESLGISTS